MSAKRLSHLPPRDTLRSHPGTEHHDAPSGSVPAISSAQSSTAVLSSSHHNTSDPLPNPSHSISSPHSPTRPPSTPPPRLLHSAFSEDATPTPTSSQEVIASLKAAGVNVIETIDQMARELVSDIIRQRTHDLYSDR